jgi:hypothetical protein
MTPPFLDQSLQIVALGETPQPFHMLHFHNKIHFLVLLPILKSKWYYNYKPIVMVESSWLRKVGSIFSQTKWNIYKNGVTNWIYIIYFKIKKCIEVECIMFMAWGRAFNGLGWPKAWPTQGNSKYWPWFCTNRL